MGMGSAAALFYLVLSVQAFTDPTTGIRGSSRLTLDHFREIYPRFPKIEVSEGHTSYCCICPGGSFTMVKY